MVEEIRDINRRRVSVLYSMYGMCVSGGTTQDVWALGYASFSTAARRKGASEIECKPRTP